LKIKGIFLLAAMGFCAFVERKLFHSIFSDLKKKNSSLISMINTAEAATPDFAIKFS